MLAKNAANTGKSGASETVEGCEIKKEPEEVMEQDTSRYYPTILPVNTNL
jgi:hypothetical protein